MTAPTITGFWLDTDDDRTLFYSNDPDLKGKLTHGGHNPGGTRSTTFVLIALDVDGEPSDTVDVQAAFDRVDPELLDRAITALTLVRDALGRTA